MRRDKTSISIHIKKEHHAPAITSYEFVSKHDSISFHLHGKSFGQTEPRIEVKWTKEINCKAYSHFIGLSNFCSFVVFISVCVLVFFHTLNHLQWLSNTHSNSQVFTLNIVFLSWNLRSKFLFDVFFYSSPWFSTKSHIKKDSKQKRERKRKTIAKGAKFTRQHNNSKRESME